MGLVSSGRGWQGGVMPTRPDLPAHRRELFQARLERWRPDLAAALAELYDDHEQVLHRLEQVAANAFSEPVSTTAPIAGSASKASSWAPSSPMSSSHSAFSAFGRLRRITPTLPSVSTRMVS